MKKTTNVLALIALALVATTANADPQYQIFDIGVIQVGDTASQGFGVSPGGIAVGRSVRSSGSQAFTWTQGGGLVGLPNLAGRNHAVSNDANDSGIVVGTAATTLFGSSRLPVDLAERRGFAASPSRRRNDRRRNRRQRFGHRGRIGRWRKLSTRSDL